MPSALKEQWGNYIRDSSSRYLYARGDAERFEAPAQQDTFLTELIRSLQAKDSHRPNRRDALLLSRLFYLTQPEVKEFFEGGLDRILRGISRTSLPEIEATRRGIRGKILWGKSQQHWLSGRGDKSVYVIRRSEKSSDTPENQLLKLFLTQITNLVHSTSASVGSGSLPEQLRLLGQSASSALQSPYIRPVSSVGQPTALMGKRCRRHRNRYYGMAARLQLQLDRVFRQNRWVTMLRLIEAGCLEPLNEDNLFELYTLTMLLRTLENKLGFGNPEVLGLIHQGRAAIARYSHQDGTKVDVYFDQSASQAIGHRSNYRALTSDYDGVNGSERRPDLIVGIELPDGKKTSLLIEVKKTEDGPYVNQSIYKGFGYLYDLSGLWNTAPDQSPKTIMAFPGGIRLKDPQSPSSELALWSATATDGEDDLRGLISQAFASAS